MVLSGSDEARATPQTLLFPLRGLAGDQPCLTRTTATNIPTNLSFYPCSNGFSAAQLWFDKAKQPRTDPCASYNPPLSGSRPKRLDFVNYQFGTAGIGFGDITNEAILRDFASAANVSYLPLYRPMGSAMLFHYLDSSGTPYILSQAEVSRILERGFRKPVRNPGEFLRMDVVKASSNTVEGGEFVTNGPGPVMGNQSRTLTRIAPE